MVKGWVYWYGSRFAVTGLGLGLLWVWVCRRRLWGLWVASFFFFLVLMVDYGLLVVVVSGVCSAMVVGSW